MSESSGFVCQTGTAYGLLKRLAILSGGAKLTNIAGIIEENQQINAIEIEI